MAFLHEIRKALNQKSVVRNILFCLAIIILMHLLYGAYRSSTVLHEGKKGKKGNKGKKGTKGKLNKIKNNSLRKTKFCNKMKKKVEKKTKMLENASGMKKKKLRKKIKKIQKIMEKVHCDDNGGDKESQSALSEGELNAAKILDLTLNPNKAENERNVENVENVTLGSEFETIKEILDTARSDDELSFPKGDLMKSIEDIVESAMQAGVNVKTEAGVNVKTEAGDTSKTILKREASGCTPSPPSALTLKKYYVEKKRKSSWKYTTHVPSLMSLMKDSAIKKCNVTSIGDFSNLNDDLTINGNDYPNLKTIEYNAFNGSIGNITFDGDFSNLTTIGEWAFSMVRGNITFKGDFSNLTTIGDSAFNMVIGDITFDGNFSNLPDKSASTSPFGNYAFNRVNNRENYEFIVGDRIRFSEAALKEDPSLVQTDLKVVKLYLEAARNARYWGKWKLEAQKQDGNILNITYRADAHQPASVPVRVWESFDLRPATITFTDRVAGADEEKFSKRFESIVGGNATRGTVFNETNAEIMLNGKVLSVFCLNGTAESRRTC